MGSLWSVGIMLTPVRKQPTTDNRQLTIQSIAKLFLHAYLCLMWIAFKEWLIVVDALGRGEQIIILRKGGLGEGHGGFKAEHSLFLLFPTLFHQQRESVVSSAQLRFDELASSLPPKDCVRIEFFCELADWQRLDSLAAAERLRGQHIWPDAVIAQRFDWGNEKNILALAVRAFRLPEVVELPMLEDYRGCKSWITLAQDISPHGAIPVLSDTGFAQKLAQFRDALKMTRVSPAREPSLGVFQ